MPLWLHSVQVRTPVPDVGECDEELDENRPPADGCPGPRGARRGGPACCRPDGGPSPRQRADPSPPKLGDVRYIAPTTQFSSPRVPGFEQLREFLIASREECALSVFRESLDEPGLRSRSCLGADGD
jgi:hypothetical protein